jgi:hypothetical protein
MYIELESEKSVFEINNFEFNGNSISFFLSDFVYLNFETDYEKKEFFKLILETNIKLKNSMSYVNVRVKPSEIINNENNSLIYLSVEKYFVISYNIIMSENVEIKFNFNSGSLSIYFENKLFEKFKESIKNDIDRSNQ